MTKRLAIVLTISALGCALIAPTVSDVYGAASWKLLKYLLTDVSCSAAGTCDLAAGTTIGGATIDTTIGGGAPAAADYLTGTSQAGISGEIVVGATPGGELGGTWSSPTIDANVIEELNQTAGETDLRYDATAESYYYDVDGDSAHDTDGTEPAVDMANVSVPGDYSTVQEALDSNDCKKGSTTANQGCRIVVSPGTYAQVFELGGTLLADTQYSIAIEGVGPSGQENGSGGQTCAVTFTGDDTANHTIIKVNGVIGWSIRNICVDMDESATNDALYGVAIGPDGTRPTKHGRMENVTIEDGIVANNVGLLLGDGSASDVAFNSFRDINFQNVGTCIVISSDQAVDQEFNGIECNRPTATIGGVSFTSAGGEAILRNFYMVPGAASQIGINIRNEAVGALLIERPTFEWSQDDGTLINFDATGNTGAFRTTTITGGRFQLQYDATTRHVCIDWNRRGTLNLLGNSFESSNANYTCEIDLNNPDATVASDVVMIGNDTEWANVRTAMIVNESSSGGALRVNRIESGVFAVGEDESIVLEGATLNAYETTIAVTDPTADRTFTIPNADSVAIQPKTCTGSDKVSAISAAGVVTCSP